MRVLMTGGGTAGHVNPAIAIANTIKKYEPDSEIAFVCSSMPNDAAKDLVPRAGFEQLYRVDICGSYKIWNPKNIKTVYYLIKSAGQAKRIVDEYKPDIIIGTGGFACYPVLNAGVKKKICTVVHESNAIPGKAVKKLASDVGCVMVNFEETLKFLPNVNNIIRVGNPVIENTSSGKIPADKSCKGTFSRMVLSFGGSRGAERLNLAVGEMYEKIADKYPDTLFYHASGKRDYEHMKTYFSEKALDKKANIKLTDYIYDMNDRMGEADIVVSRAGAMTLSEIALYGKAAVIVPSPNVAANHQYKNACALSNVGAACLVEEKDFDDGKLVSTVVKLLDNENECNRLRSSVKKFAFPESNKMIYEKIRQLLDEKNRT